MTPEAKREEVGRLRAQGLKMREVSAALGIPLGSVTRIANHRVKASGASVPISPASPHKTTLAEWALIDFDAKPTHGRGRWTKSIRERYEEKIVNGSDLDDCWGWSGATSDFGYGTLGIGVRQERAHRISWVMCHGPIPEDINVLHTCDNPPCSNPRHLFLGTQRDNTNDAISKGRHKTPFGNK
jgi:hypothetical protein